MRDRATVSPSRRSAAPRLPQLVAEFQWASTPLGPHEQWPAWLKHAVALILLSPVPMVLLVGRAGVMVYNDAYAPIAAKRHPAALGARVHDVWPEIADFVERAHTGVLAGRTLTFHNQPLTLDRSGLPEAAWFDLDYSPVVDDDARPAAALVVVQETTAKVLAERREREQQERLRQMFEQAPGFIAMLRGPRHVFELANAAYLQLVGHREILGLTAREALPEIEGQGFFELLDDVYASGKPFIGQAMPALLQRSPGAVPEQRHLDFVFQPVTDTTDKVMGIFVQGTDVTERVAATEATKAREKLFRSFAETMPNHVWSAGLDGKLDWLNARTYEYSGAAAGALDGDGWAQIVHPEDLPAVAVRWAESVATGSTYETEFRVRRADGVYRWHIVRAVQVKDEAGKPTQWIGTSTDYEDQRQVRDQLAQSERMLRLSQQAAGIASMEIDVATDRMSGTDSLWEKFGLPIQESAPVVDFVALVLPEDRRLTSTPASRKAGDAAASAEFRIRRADTNEVRWLSRNLEFVRDATGSPVKIFGALRDITEQKKAEAQQVMLAHELEHRIKNILSVVSAIASQTLRGDDINTARITLAKRFAALGETHALLSKAHWTSVPMQEVVERSIMALPGDRIRVAGPAVSLDPKRALSMALAINELATNSIKYGALANAGGQVEITWQREQTPDEADQIVWQWQETGARDVVAPTRSGFGRFLIEEVLAGDFGGAVTLDFAATGLCCRLVAPWLAS